MAWKPEENRTTISYSEISTYIACPFKHKLTYLDNIEKFQDNAAMAYGRCVHHGVQSLWGMTLEQAQASFSAMLREEFGKLDVPVGNENSKGELLIFQAHKMGFPEIKHLGIEYVLDEEISDGLYFKGFIDIVLSDGETVKLIDFKTTERGWNNYKRNDFTVRMQLYLYKYFYAKKNNIPYDQIELEFVLLQGDNRSVEVFKLEHSDKDIEMAYAVLMRAAQSIYEKQYFPKNIKACQYCQFNNRPEICDRKTNILRA